MLFFSISIFADDQTSSCLTNLSHYQSKYYESWEDKENASVLLCADQVGAERPFSSGGYSSKLKSTALPYGNEGIIVLSNNEYHFVGLPNEKMKMDETRYVQFQINNKWHCGKFNKTFARPTFGHGMMGEIIEHLAPSEVGYNFKYSEDKKCLNAPIKTGHKSDKKELHSFVVGTIKRMVQENSGRTNDFVGGAGLKSILASSECEECGTVPRALYHEYRNILNGCLKNSKDSQLNQEIMKNLNDLDREAKPRGFL